MAVPLAPSQRGVLLDALSPGVLKAVTITFLLLFVSLVFTTAFAPYEGVYQEDRTFHTVHCDNPCSYGGCPAGMLTKLAIGRMRPTHQLLYSEARSEPPEFFESGRLPISFQQRVDISAEGFHKMHVGRAGTGEPLWEHEQSVTDVECRASEALCDPVTLFHQSTVRYGSYYLNVTMDNPFTPFCPDTSALEAEGLEPAELERRKQALLAPTTGRQHMRVELYIVFVSRAFTQLELSLKYSLLCVALMTLLLWTCKLRTLYGRYSREQRWIRALLIGVALFNNPLTAAEIYGSSVLLTVWGVLCDVSFVALLLLYWLRALDTVGRSPAGEDFERHPLWFWAPKISLTVGIWSASLALYASERMERSVDPTYNAVDDLTYFTSYKVVSIALLVAYLLYAALLLFRALRAVHTGTMRLPYQWIAIFSSMTILLVVIGLLFGFFAPIPYRSNGFVAYYTLLNAHVFILAFAFTPFRPPVEEGMELQAGGGGGAARPSVESAPFLSEDADEALDGSYEPPATTLGLV